jgi:hypothetical protein
MALNIDTSEFQFFMRAVIINIKKLINKCIDSYNNLFLLDTESVCEIHNELGDDLEKKGNDEGAIMAYCRILLTDPTNTNVLLKLGRIGLKLQLFQFWQQLLLRQVDSYALTT